MKTPINQEKYMKCKVVQLSLVIIGNLYLGCHKLDTDINVIAIKKEIANGKSVLIDVRTDVEWQTGKAKGAIHFELSRLQNGEMPELDRDRRIYVYCQSGMRSKIAQQILTDNGFNNAINLGGLGIWQTKGGKIDKP
tara:strand:+ start:203 stop:613 length:411 start_codon:yes stop_codon:yes gene_type:complete